jgi:hypothetical protein
MQSSPAHRTRLRAFDALLRAQGFPTGLVLETPEVPYDVLVAGLSDADETRQWQLELSFVPGMEEQLDGAALLQCFVHLPAEVPPAAEDGLRRLVVLLNTRIPILGFGWLEAERMPCFRHTLMLPEDNDSAGALMVQTAWMIGYLLSVFAGTVQEVASGTRTVDEAMRDNQFRAVFG